MALSELAGHRAVAVEAAACEGAYLAKLWRHVRKLHRPTFVFIIDGRRKLAIVSLE
jgi:hypothetical protein